MTTNTPQHPSEPQAGQSLDSSALLDGEFYAAIEAGVREWVFRFRNAGLNTECSCHHEGFIQCQSLDPTTELHRIKTVMLEAGIQDFTIDLHCEGCGRQTLEIRSEAFRSANTR